ncbi:hypothetical protein C1X12_25525 [Pseudomonas sp. FW305-60]|nr:hypothetical protein C1X12_25525 [Pseudomonas sp. FW305-60]
MARGLAPVGLRSSPIRNIACTGNTTAAQPNGGEPPRHKAPHHKSPLTMRGGESETPELEPSDGNFYACRGMTMHHYRAILCAA